MLKTGRPHDRVFGQQEQDSIKCMGNQMYDHTKNPGIHVFPSFLSQMESLSLLSEVKGIQKKYGISLISPMHAAMYR
ncbi:hypothetical protein CEUSTIGMA_g2493.t1 [Chlamydomonas eustigma]|uniref:Uncharacterized protein n=1 Tax=Chlamydomonas eustigma TaxID=1157962 RepID=A0A250WWG9_9CHLO|nr:hypothetical protein CEUSTIGMA_g2493.t1 [Chlamydomonas eustigma]|eukprot:GAX75049.1 hypothetical protein CEUSTIGMA_g2493.t1 [Chlamydomonas eustigma]